MPRDIPPGPPMIAEDGDVLVNGNKVTDSKLKDGWVASCKAREKNYLGPGTEECPGIERPGKISPPQEYLDKKQFEEERQRAENALDIQLKEYYKKKYRDLADDVTNKNKALKRADEDYTDCERDATKLYVICIAACTPAAPSGLGYVACLDACILGYDVVVKGCRNTRDKTKRRAKEDYENKEKEWEDKNRKPVLPGRFR